MAKYIFVMDRKPQNSQEIEKIATLGSNQLCVAQISGFSEVIDK